MGFVCVCCAGKKGVHSSSSCARENSSQCNACNEQAVKLLCWLFSAQEGESLQVNSQGGDSPEGRRVPHDQRFQVLRDADEAHAGASVGDHWRCQSRYYGPKSQRHGVLGGCG